jgi:hypothetical protein
VPRNSTQEIIIPINNFSKGIVGSISERGSTRRPDWLAAADNLYGRPYRGMRVRPGSRDLSTGILSDAPHSLMAFYSGGGNKLFVGAANKILEVGAGAYTLQVLPGGHPANSDVWSHVNLQGVLVAAQRGSGLSPLRYAGTWDELKLPKPVVAPTFNAFNPGGSVNAGNHYYRIRWRFANGSSLVSPTSAVIAVVGPNNTVVLNVTESARADYLGWTLERTKLNGTVNGPFWFVQDGSGLIATDTTADADLGYLPDEGLHGEPPQVDGIASWNDRLWGWKGSLLSVSQKAYGDSEATGIANWDPELAFPVSMDDGDTIQVCVPVLDEFLILKRRSVHVMSGVDPDSFILTPVVYADPGRGSEAGCGGPRAACVIGGVAYFWGESGGLFTYAKGTVKPVGWIEMGTYLDTLNQAALDNLVLINHQGNYFLAWYPKGSVTTAEDQIVRDVRMNGQWWHWGGWAARDVIELKAGLLGSSQAICDPKNYGSFPAIPDTSPITGPGIPGATTVTPAVVAGATSLNMSANATATAQDVTLTINGIVTPHCNTTIGSPVVTITEYHCWSTFDGFRDRRLQDGSGGAAPRVMFEPPWLDYGMPDDWKDLDRVSFSAEGDVPAVTVSVSTDPDGGDCALLMPTTGTGAEWAMDVGSGPNDLDWDLDDWAQDAPGTVSQGCPAGTIGRRFKLTVTAEPTGDFRPSGMELVAVLLPDKEYDT